MTITQLIEAKQGPECYRCPLVHQGVAVEDRLPTAEFCGLSIVGEMPGKLEVLKRLPLMGPTGGIIRGIAAGIGMDMETVHVTNCIRCGLPGGAKLTDAEGLLAADCCRPLVNNNLKTMGTTTALCIGSIPWASLANLKGIDKYRGTVLPGDEFEPWNLTCTLHPAGLLHVSSRAVLAELVYADIRKAWHLATGVVTMWAPEIRDSSDVDALVTWLEEVSANKTPIACDVETDGIHPFEHDLEPCNLLTAAFATMDKDTQVPVAYSIPYPKAYPDFYDPQQWMRIDNAIRNLFKDREQPIVFHNKRFDVPVLERHWDSYIDAIKEDTLLLHHAVCPKLPHKLQQVTSQFLAVEPWKDQYKDTESNIFSERADAIDDWEDLSEEEQEEALTQIRDLDNTSFSELLWYNACDAAATIHIYHLLMAEAQEDNVLDVYMRDRELDDETLQWTLNGIGIDLDQRAKLEVEYDARIDAKISEMRSTCLLPTDKDMAKRIDPILQDRAETDVKARRLGRVSTLMKKFEDGGSLPKSKEDLIAKLESQRDKHEGDALKRLEIKIKKAYQDQGDIDLATSLLEGGQLSDNIKAESESLKTLLKQQLAIVKNIQKMPTQEGFKPGSANHVREILMLRGLSPTKVCAKAKDKDGNRLLSVSKDSMWDLRDDIFVGTLFDWRTDAKLQSTYIRKLEYRLGKDGRLHPNWRLPATPSGRFGTQPAVQNFPHAMKYLMVPSEGCVLVGADYAALELRIAALLGDEPAWIKTFLANGDLHSLMAHKYFSQEYPDLDAMWQATEGDEKAKDKAVPRRKELRGRGKNITFGDIYLAGAETLYYQVREKMPDIKTPEQHMALRREVARNQAVLRAATPNRVEYAAISQRFATENNYLTSPFWVDQYGNKRGGRCRKWPLGDPSPNETANHPIQSMAADIMNSATMRLVNWLQTEGIYCNGAWIILQIHDALYLEVEKQYAELVKEFLERALYTEIEYRSPVTNRVNLMKFTADAKIGMSVAEV